jgi:hypothetical protein
MHQEILSQAQIELLSLVSHFKREFYLVGGTAIALQIGHRRSIDFDLFKEGALNHKKILDIISTNKLKCVVTRRVEEQLNLIVNDVKFTFFQYPYKIKSSVNFKDYFRMPALLDLAAMKAFALGRRSKWKDYVDMYFIIKHYFSTDQIADRATSIFGQLFSEKLFRAQLCYFDDVDYTEPVDFITTPVVESEIRKFLTETAIDFPLL